MSIFRELHVKGDPFVLANAWDRGSARMLEVLGAKAIATSSAAHAFTMGLPDGGTVSRDDALAHAQELMSVVSVPVSGDFENGYGDDPETCAETVRLSGEVGLAGICIEDTAFPSGDPYPFELAVERVRAASSAARALRDDFFFVARADGLLTRTYDIDEAVRRIQAFDEAGADGLYAPIPRTMEDLARIIGATDKPVNILVAGPYAKLPLSRYAEMGAARVSLGSALARVTHRVINDSAVAMFESGDFTSLGQAISGDVVDEMLTRE
jgi:2-methylisocitrate lyase-like PEP mutase family enzyme